MVGKQSGYYRVCTEHYLMCPEQATWQLSSPEEAESGMHGGNESPEIPPPPSPHTRTHTIPEGGILFYLGETQEWYAAMAPKNQDFPDNAILSLFLKNGHQQTNHKGLCNSLFLVIWIQCCDLHKFRVFTRASSEGRHKREVGEDWGRGSDNWSWNELSFPVC